MRILLVTHRFLPRFLAGTEVYTGLLAHGLQERGHTLAIFSGDPSIAAAEAYDWEGVPVRLVPWRAGGRSNPVATFLAGFLNPAVERQFAQACLDFKPEVVHIQHLMGLSPRLPAMSRQFGAAVIITLHDYWFRCSNTMLFRYSDELCPGPGAGYHCGGCALQRLGRKPNRPLMALAAPIFVLRTLVLRRALLTADRVVAPSRVAAGAFAADRRLAAKLRVVPHGLRLARPVAPSARRVQGRPPRLAYIGSIVRPKGVHVILKAFGALPEHGEELHLYGDLTADPAYVAELRQLTGRAGVFFHGTVERQRVPEVMYETDMVLVPSLWRETYSVIVDEAFAAGVPVLVSAQSAAAERVLAGINGLVAPAGDVEAWRRQLERICNEPALLSRLQQGVSLPETVAQHTGEIEALYTEALAGRRR